MKIKKILVLIAIIIFVGCSTDADIASYNLSKAAEMFEINRRVIFYNGITGDYMLSIEGRCSIEADGVDNQLEVTLKTGPKTYKKHFLGLSDNISYFSEQLDPAMVDDYRYRIIFKPKSVIPDIDLVTDTRNMDNKSLNQWNKKKKNNVGPLSSKKDSYM